MRHVTLPPGCDLCGSSSHKSFLVNWLLDFLSRSLAHTVTQLLCVQETHTYTQSHMHTEWHRSCAEVQLSQRVWCLIITVLQPTWLYCCSLQTTGLCWFDSFPENRLETHTCTGSKNTCKDTYRHTGSNPCPVFPFPSPCSSLSLSNWLLLSYISFHLLFHFYFPLFYDHPCLQLFIHLSFSLISFHLVLVMFNSPLHLEEGVAAAVCC